MESLNILVLGSGGREHALAWRIGKSPRCKRVYLHPGNSGTVKRGFEPFGDLAPGMDAYNAKVLIPRAKELGIGLVVIGPETLLEKGLADDFRAAGFPVVGPNRAAARLETSKVFAKQIMERAGVQTARFVVVETAAELATAARKLPIVLKLDGLAAGKGVVVATTPGDVEQFTRRLWPEGNETRGEFGPGPHRVVVETFIGGHELSYMGLCDGRNFVPLASATDYKRVGTGNQGPNTGGMGAISPSPYLSEKLASHIETKITRPLTRYFDAQNFFYRGVLYVGLMITPGGEPYVLEFNARFGDPETQAVLLRLESDFVDLLEATALGKLDACPAARWSRETSLYVVGAAEGYPEKPQLGDPIAGLDRIPDGIEVFYSGVRAQGESLVTAGGRVLGLGGLGKDADEVRQSVYAALDSVKWRGQHFRKDIGIKED